MEVFKPIKVENYQFMKNGLNQYWFTLKKKVILWREYGYFVAIIKEGFRNFDLKNLDLEFQIKKNRKIRESKKREI